MAAIVVVEDNPDNMKLFRAVLRRGGHGVKEFVTGVGLADALAESRPDLVLLDIQLPDLDGYQVLEELRAKWGADLRVVALTAHALGSDRERAREAGFDGFITKPIDVTEFPHQVARAVAGERVFD
jgi:two-component system cell cycle response regulator DivK